MKAFVAAPPLPYGWEMMVDHTGRVFYFDHTTRTSHWNPPVFVAPPPAPVFVAPPPPAPAPIFVAPAPAPAPMIVEIHPARPPPTAPPQEKEKKVEGGFVAAEVPKNPMEADVVAAHQHIMSYFRAVETLNGVMVKELNPPSTSKTLIGRMTAPKAGDLRPIKLTREQKNDVLTKGRSLLDKFNMFIFDYNRYAKTLPERQYNEIAILLGQFLENLDKFSAVVIKSETVKECLGKLKAKFGCISIDFSQRLSYQNNGSQTADFNHHQVIQDTGASTLMVNRNY